MDLKPPINENKKHIAISILANDDRRFYGHDNWRKVINMILSTMDDRTDLLFLGSKAESSMVDSFINTLATPERCVNLAGRTTVSYLSEILSQCEYLLSVETGTVHIAQACGCKVVCLSCGAFYGQFHPYKNPNIKYVYPKEFNDFITNGGDGKEFYNLNFQYSMDSIKPEEVLEKINSLYKSIS